MSGVALPIVFALAVIGFVGGVGISSIGPGGVLPTIGLFALTGLGAPTVAGTAIVTHVATGVAGSAAYWRSGQLRRPATRQTATILAGTAVIGTPIGVWINSLVSDRWFGIALAVLVVAAAGMMWLRESLGARLSVDTHPRSATVVALGLAVSLFSGVVGIGGPMLTVPLLIACGVRVLESLAASQVQSIVIACVGSVGYAAQGAVDWRLAAVVGVPELVGVVVGWRIAHALPAHTLKVALTIALLALAPYLVITA